LRSRTVAGGPVEAAEIDAVTLSRDDRSGRAAAEELPDADVSLAAEFERCVALHRFRTALHSDLWQPSYDELNATANRLAHALLVRSAPGDRIAILMAHDAPEIAAAVAAFKAGCIVVALNPTFPRARLRQIVEHSEPAAIITDAANRELAADIAGPRCRVVGFEEASVEGPLHNPAIAISPNQTAVLGYTSGSTGRPKAVMMTHRQFRRNSIVLTEAMEYSAVDRLPLFGSLSNGQGISNMWCALLNGATLCPFPLAVKGVTGLADWMGERGITAYNSSASVFRSFMKTLDDAVKFAGVRAVRLSSEPATSDDFELFRKHFLDDCVFVHTLSCSETCNVAWSRRSHGDSVPKGRLPIGMPSKGHKLLLLDESDRTVAPGEVGKIVLQSRYAAAGYWRDPALTAERFSDEIDGVGTRFVHTGDLGRINAAGMLEFFGRKDDLVKIRGNRIQFAEIENAVQRMPGIERAVVEAVPRAGREPALVGFVILREGHSLSPAELRRALRANLPDHMVPSTFVFLDALPFTVTGKVDRESLRLHDLAPHAPERSQQPVTDIEALLARIWSDVFGLNGIGAHDDFFELGGDSLMAAVVAARVHSAVGVALNLGMFADHPTVAALARIIDRHRDDSNSDEAPLVRASRETPLPLSYAQERAWLASQTDRGLCEYVHANRYRILGPLDREILLDCLSDLFRRHEVLRTTYPIVDGRPVQVIHAPGPAELPYFDLAGAADAEAKADQIFKSQTVRKLDLGRLPLMLFSIVRVRENEHWLQRVLHHINSDAWSSDVFYRELALLYAAKRRGETPPLPDALDLQYADYAAWERETLRADRPRFREAVAWWRNTLAGSAPVELPCRRSLTPSARPRSALWRRLASGFGRAERQTPITPDDGMVRWGLDPETSRRLEHLGRKAGATYFLLRLAVFVALLASETNQQDILVGTYVTNRKRLALHGIHGLFVNLVALRFRYQPMKSFREWLSIVRDVTMAAEAHGDVPFDMLCEELERSGQGRPPIEVIFQISQNRRTMEFADLKMIWMEQHFQSMPWGFCMNPDERAEQDNCRVSFDATIYHPAGVREFVARYKRLLDAVSRHPDMTVDGLLAMSGTAPIERMSRR
jgi:amino acid adenylation domain-containing protein